MRSPPKQTTAALALLALGVVYGDIGTSPLYAAKETFSPVHGIPLNAGKHPWRCFGDLLGADDRRLPQVRGAGGSREQSR